LAVGRWVGFVPPLDEPLDDDPEPSAPPLEPPSFSPPPDPELEPPDAPEPLDEPVLPPELLPLLVPPLDPPSAFDGDPTPELPHAAASPAKSKPADTDVFIARIGLYEATFHVPGQAAEK
jgi:hypothetical protein